MPAKYDAVVIGTGFGGAVSACRLAQAGLKVGVFERGRRYEGYNKFPRNWNDPTDGWLWEHEQGLFDVKPVSEMFIVQAAAYGGGSQIYANVHLRVPPDGFAHGWPEGYTRELLDPYYDLVAYMLDINPIAATPYNPLPPKTLLMREVAAKLGRSEQFCYPNIAVNLGDPRARKQNKFGATQSGCSYCGECDIGCNNQAKNTLDLNYLPLAARTGNMDVAVRSEVTKIEPSGAGYRIYYRDHEHAQDEQAEAAAVFVCAGAINTTELLLRCRDQHHTLPNLSTALGYRYSGNGDYLAFAFETAKAFEPSTGPTITTGTVYDRGTDEQRAWFIFEEGGFPKELASLLQLLNPKHGVEGEMVALAKKDLERLAVALGGGRVGKNGGGGTNSAVFLGMGGDLANGCSELLPLTNLLRIHWDVPSNMPLYSAEERFSRDVAKALGGEMAYNPTWKLLRQPVSVHNLGGCCMADHAVDGVVDSEGQVYGYANLFVMDGSALPAATGTNPSHTIAAVAERNIERFIRRYKRDPAWHAPEYPKAKRVVDPLNLISIPTGGTRPPETSAVGIAFTETMKGFLSPTTVEPETQDQYIALENKAEAANSPAQFTLTITVADVDEFIANKNHAAVARGEVRATGFTPAGGASVTAGVFHLFEQTDSLNARKMFYLLPFYGMDGQPYVLTGYKDVRDHGKLDVWPSTRTLYTLIRKGHEEKAPVVAAGVLHILKSDFAHQLTTFRTIGASSPLAGAEAMARFGRLFMGTLFDVFVRPRLDF